MTGSCVLQHAPARNKAPLSAMSNQANASVTNSTKAMIAQNVKKGLPLTLLAIVSKRQSVRSQEVQRLVKGMVFANKWVELRDVIVIKGSLMMV